MGIKISSIVLTFLCLPLMSAFGQPGSKAEFQAQTITGGRYMPAPYPVLRVPVNKIKACTVGFEQNTAKKLTLRMKVQSNLGGNQEFIFSNVPNFVDVNTAGLKLNREVMGKVKSSEKIRINEGGSDEMVVYSLNESTLSYYIDRLFEARNVHEKAEMVNIYQYQETQTDVDKRLLDNERKYRVAQVYFDPQFKDLKMVRIAEDYWDVYCYFFKF